MNCKNVTGKQFTFRYENIIIIRATELMQII